MIGIIADGRHKHGLYPRQIVHAVLGAEFREPAGGIEVSPPCIFVLDIRGEEIEEALCRPRLFKKQGRGLLPPAARSAGTFI